jgi:tetratricopeptide (TPR) repeat protein
MDRVDRVSLERIEITPFAVIVGDILQNRRSGELTIIRGALRDVMYWSQGELVLITSQSPQDSLADFLARRGVMTADRAFQLITDDSTDVVSRFHEMGVLDLSTRQTLLREWVTSLFIPLFSLDEGTTAFNEEEPIPPEKRVFLQSTAALILEAIRSITNGLLLRRSLGDLKREIVPERESRFTIDSIALTDAERRIASALAEPQTIEGFLRHFATESVIAAKVVIGMLTLGVYTTVVEHGPREEATADLADMQKDLELLAAIGSSDQRSLRAVALSRQLTSFDHYQVLDVPRAATRAQIIAAAERLKKIYDPMTFPLIVRESVQMIERRIDEAMNALKDANRRVAYDKALTQPGQRSGGEAGIQQRLTQRSIAQQNFAKARELSAAGDYYGAIVLLKQAVNFAPDMAEAWFLLGSCQERNPRWRRDAAESLQKTLSVDPNHIEAMISLGDLYKQEGLTSRAQTCYEDALKIAPDNQQAKSRLAGVKRK